MKRAAHFAIIAVLAAEALIIGQGSEAARVLNDMRAVLGGDKLAAVKSFTVSGRSARTAGQFQLTGDVEIFCELPDKYLKKENLSMGGMASASSTLGFNGETLIQDTSSPSQPMAHGGGMMVVRAGPGGPMPGGAQPTPEQQAAMKANMLRSAKTDFTRLTVAFFGASFAGNPVTFVHAGQAESPDGKADVIEIKGANDFAAKLYIDEKTHRPLMMSWQAPGVQMMTSNMGGARPVAAGGGAMVFSGGGASTSTGGTQGVQSMNEDRMKELMAQAQKLVEHRMYFSDYRDVDGVKLPFQIVRSVDGNTSEELTFEKFKLNPKIDDKKFKN